MTPAALETLAADAARAVLRREPTAAEIMRVLATWCCQLDSAVSAGFMRRPPLKAPRPPKKPPPEVR